jgi:hypothetical protein
VETRIPSTAAAPEITSLFAHENELAVSGSSVCEHVLARKTAQEQHDASEVRKLFMCYIAEYGQCPLCSHIVVTPAEHWLVPVRTIVNGFTLPLLELMCSVADLRLYFLFV